MSFNKKNLGQFFTTNYDYILQNFNIPDNVINIIEPFSGNCDLIKFIKNITKYNVEYYDIEPKLDYIIQRDTILNPPDYSNKFILTNPPYLARNKAKDKILFDKYSQNDLYKCFLFDLINNQCLGGIIIIPLNFWCSIRKNDIELRKNFLNIYNILNINIFEETVFDDTSYTICSFQFEIKKQKKDLDINIIFNNLNINKDLNSINVIMYPSKKEIKISLNNDNNYMIGGEIYKLKQNKKYIINRLTSKNIQYKLNTNILVKCIDDNINNKIKLSYVNDDLIYIDETPNLSSRTYATLVITPKLNKDEQLKLVNDFNTLLEDYREKYHSLFLTNYRESKDIARKRISFDLVYKIVNHLLI
jgi:hypothetical protein